LSAINTWRRVLTRNDSQGSVIAGVVSEVTRKGLVRSVMSITGTPGFLRVALGTAVA